MKTTLKSFSLGVLMGTMMNLSAEAVDPSADREQPSVQDVGWSEDVPEGQAMKQRMPHASGENGQIVLKNLDPTEIEARKNSMGTE